MQAAEESLPTKRNRKKREYPDYYEDISQAKKALALQSNSKRQKTSHEPTTPTSYSTANEFKFSDTPVKQYARTKKDKAIVNKHAEEILPPATEIPRPQQREARRESKKASIKKRLEQQLEQLETIEEKVATAIEIKRASPASPPKVEPTSTASFATDVGASSTPSRPHRSTAGRRSFNEPDPDLHKCLDIIRKLMTHKYAWPFNQPVDPVALNIPDYFLVIKRPMDFGTIRKNLEQLKYTSISEFVRDVRQVFDNAFLYNAPNSEICHMARTLEQTFDKRFLSVFKRPAETSEELKKAASLPSELQSPTAITEPLSPPASGSSGGTTKPRPRSRRFTMQKKLRLSERIGMLESDELGNVVKIIHDRMPEMISGSLDQDEIEINIDVLDDATLNALEEYTLKCLEKRQLSDVPLATQIHSISVSDAVRSPRSRSPRRKRTEDNNKENTQDTEGKEADGSISERADGEETASRNSNENDDNNADGEESSEDESNAPESSDDDEVNDIESGASDTEQPLAVMEDKPKD